MCSDTLQVSTFIITGTDTAEKESGPNVPSCPNKWNPYHECSAYCAQLWGEKSNKVGTERGKLFFEPDSVFRVILDLLVQALIACQFLYIM